MSIPKSLRPYNALDSREVELQPLGVGEDVDSAPFTVFSRSKRWRLPPWEQITARLGSPRAQKWFWLLVAAVVTIVAGVVLTSAKRQQTQLPTTGNDGSSSTARSSSVNTAAFPAEPWVTPSGMCSVADNAAAAGVLGPQRQLAVPLNYRVLLQFEEAHFAVGGAAEAAVAKGFQAEANITLAIQQETSCLQLAATDLTFSSIHASLLTGTALLQQSQPADVCLCGSEAGCVTDNCASLFKASKDPSLGSSTWLCSLGPLVAPAGSTLLLATRHTAHFSLTGQGVVRSAAITPQPPPGATAPAQQVMIATALEPYGAERVFPCVEEPHNKATFAVVIDAPDRFTILSNMPEAARSPSSSGAGRVAVAFLPSPPMSAYLVAFAVGEMQAASANTSSGQLVRVWSPRIPSWLAAAEQSLALAAAALEHYTQYTNLQQPLTKFDLVAVPGRTGAMESWGMLLFDPERFLVTLPSAWSLFRAADVICHELAHQWFGNIVTAHTWGNLLANEGLASLAEYGCMAEVMTKQLGVTGAAALMTQVIGPQGRLAGVHEGPFAKAVEYDALPTAAPLLGAISPDFGVPTYSRAAAVMAMLTQYAASARLGLTDQAAPAGGPVASLVAGDPPEELQVALQHYLRSRIYGTATALDVLQLFLALTADDMAGSSAAVMAAWHQPGSPLLAVQHTEQGLQVSQRRFCSAGLLLGTFLDKLLSKAAGSSDSIPTPATPEATSPAESVESSTGGSTGRATGLSCPVVIGQGDRAVPWTPVLLAALPSSSSSSSSSNVANNGAAVEGSTALQANASQTSVQRTNGSLTAGGSSAIAACGTWQVINRDSQLLQLPACLQNGTAPSTGDAATLPQQQQLLVLEGDGGWGLYITRYAAAQREQHRQWVAQQLLPVMQQLSAAPASAAVDQLAHGLQLLMIAAKLLKDQARLALSPFGEVPALELLEAVQAASAVAAAAAATAAGEVNEGLSTWPGFGVVTYNLLSPLLPLVDEMLDRVAARPLCRVSVEERLASMLAPVVTTALQAYGRPSSSAGWNITAKLPQQQYTSSDQLLGAMALSSLLTTAGMTDSDTAHTLCQEFNSVAAAAVASGGDLGTALLKQLQPDARDAVLAVAAAQPTGCQLDVTGLKLVQILQQVYFTASDSATCQTAAFALAHAASRATRNEEWQEVLGVLLGLLVPSVQGQAAGQTPGEQPLVQLACGVPFSSHALELATVVSRGVISSRVHQQARAGPADVGPDDGQTLGPVLQYLMQRWQQVVLVLGQQKAWHVFVGIAVQEIQTAGQWQHLVQAVLQQPSVFGAEQRLHNSGISEQQRERLNSLLGMTWSNVVWGAHHLAGLCKGV